MTTRTPETTIQLMKGLYFGEGSSVAEVSRETGISYYIAYNHTRRHELGNKSDYEISMDGIRKNGFGTYREYQNRLAIGHGFGSIKDYQKTRDREKQKKEENRALGKSIRDRLDDLGETQIWLAEQLDVDKRTISHYVTGRRFPSEEMLESIHEVLNIGLERIVDEAAA